MNDKHFAQITHFLGDKEYTLNLTWEGAVEWEDTTGKSLFGTFNEMVERTTGRVAEVREVIRLALIGGGLSPSDTFKLVNRYVNNRPLSESVPVALAVMEAFLFGVNELEGAAKDGPNG